MLVKNEIIQKHSFIENGKLDTKCLIWCSDILHVNTIQEVDLNECTLREENMVYEHISHLSNKITRSL
jgi:hypothetical protein